MENSNARLNKDYGLVLGFPTFEVSNPSHNKTRRGLIKYVQAFGLMAVLFGTLFVSCSNDTYAASINLTIDSSTVGVDAMGLNDTGTFVSSSPSTISVTSDSESGYSLHIKSTNGTDLVSGSNTISSIDATTSEADFSAAENTTYNNKWGYKPSKLNGEDNTNFLPGPSTTGDILDTVWAPNSTANTYTLALGARITKNTPPGSYSNTFVVQAVSNGPVLTINYDGNGLYFDNDSTKTTNAVRYDATYGAVTYTEKYSYTPNINDAGIQDGDYDDSYTMNDVVTIDGANTLHIKLTYAGESANYDWVSFWAGNYPSYTAASNYSTGVQNCGGGTVTNGKYGGGDGTTVECDINGDTVTFAFESDDSDVGNGYGYYAVITGYDSNGNLVNTGTDTKTETIYVKSIFNGEYKTPGHNDGGYNFLGWSEDQNATTPTYETEANISSDLEKVNGDPAVTLYAIYQKLFTITYHPNFTGATASDQTQTIVAGTSANLKQAGTSTFTRTGYKIKEWNTKADGSGTSYAGNSSYSVPTNISFGASMDLYAIWVPVYQVIYNGNGADAGVMTNVKHTNVEEGDKFDLYASNFSRSGYGFAGWSLDSNAQPGGSSRIYGPNEIFTAPAHSGSNTITLYAVWVPSAGNLQNWTGCSSMNVGDVTALTDQRDNDTYAVAKLADENCWMIENLRLDNTATGNTDGSLAQGYANGFVGLADPETSNFSGSTTANSLYSTTNITGSHQGYRFPRFNYANTNARAANPSATDDRATATSTHGTNLSSSIYSYGNYYTWAAAIADIGDHTYETVVTSTSLCPKGWKLPYGNASTETSGGKTKGGFSYLDTKLGGSGATQSTEEASNRWRSFPNNFLFSGYFSGSFTGNRGSDGRYWSTTVSGYNYASDVLYLRSSRIDPGTSSYGKDVGLSIRCIAGT